MIKISEIRALSDGDLRERLDSSKQELMNLRVRVAARQLENTAQIRSVKRDVQRLMTVVRERQLARQGQREVQS